MEEDRYADDGLSQDFSDTENENEHFSAPAHLVQRTFQETDHNRNDMSNESWKARRDKSVSAVMDIRKTAKTNVRN